MPSHHLWDLPCADERRVPPVSPADVAGFEGQLWSLSFRSSFMLLCQLSDQPALWSRIDARRLMDPLTTCTRYFTVCPWQMLADQKSDVTWHRGGQNMILQPHGIAIDSIEDNTGNNAGKGVRKRHVPDLTFFWHGMMRTAWWINRVIWDSLLVFHYKKAVNRFWMTLQWVNNDRICICEWVITLPVNLRSDATELITGHCQHNLVHQPKQEAC